MADLEILPTILITDDDTEFLGIVAHVMREADFNVVTATSGNEALDLYLKAKQEKTSIDAIISDVDMANGTGIGLLKSLRELDPSTPFFFMTGGTKIDAQKAKQLGATGLFEKPFVAKAIISELNETLGRVHSKS